MTCWFDQLKEQRDIAAGVLAVMAAIGVAVIVEGRERGNEQARCDGPHYASNEAKRLATLCKLMGREGRSCEGDCWPTIDPRDRQGGAAALCDLLWGYFESEDFPSTRASKAARRRSVRRVYEINSSAIAISPASSLQSVRMRRATF